MKPSSENHQLGWSRWNTPRAQDRQDPDPSRTETGLDASDHIHFSSERTGRFFLLTSPFIGQLTKVIVFQCDAECAETSSRWHLGFVTFSCTVIECRTYDLQFRMLIMHRCFHISVAHRSHYGCQIPCAHQNTRAIVMARTAQHEFFWKPSFLGSPSLGENRGYH